MALSYHLVPRKDMRKNAAPDAQLYFPQIRAGSKIPFAKLCDAIAGHTTASKGDVQIVISGLLYMLRMYLDLGLIVQVGELGNFRMSAASQGVEEKKEFNASLFRKSRVIFTPGALLRQVVKDTTYEELKPVKGDAEECDKEHVL